MRRFLGRSFSIWMVGVGRGSFGMRLLNCARRGIFLNVNKIMLSFAIKIDNLRSYGNLELLGYKRVNFVKIFFFDYGINYLIVLYIRKY